MKNYVNIVKKTERMLELRASHYRAMVKAWPEKAEIYQALAGDVEAILLTIKSESNLDNVIRIFTE